MKRKEWVTTTAHPVISLAPIVNRYVALEDISAVVAAKNIYDKVLGSLGLKKGA